MARKDKKDFLSEQCKDIEENKRMGRLKISLWKLKIPREHFMQDRQKQYGPNRSRLRKSGKNIEKNCTK